MTVSDGDFSAFSRLQVLALAEDAGTVEDAEASEEDEVCYSYEFLLFFSLRISLPIGAWNGGLLFHRYRLREYIYKQGFVNESFQ